MRWSWTVGLLIAGCALVVLFITIPNIASRLDDTPGFAQNKAQKDLESLAVLVEAFHEHNNRYPRDDEGLPAVTRFGVGMGHAPERRPTDPWGRPYVYHARPDGPPELYSLGPNGIDEHAKGDDISISVK